MQLQITITDLVPDVIVKAYKTERFVGLYGELLRGILGIDNVGRRPAEYNVVLLRSECFENHCGIMARLVDVSRADRDHTSLREVRMAIQNLVKYTLREALFENNVEGQMQASATIVLDGEIPIAEGSDIYSNLIEGPAHWVDQTGTVVAA